MTRGQLYTRVFWGSTAIMFAIWFLFGFGLPEAGELNQSTLEPYTWFDAVKMNVFVFVAGDFGLFWGYIMTHGMLSMLFG